MLPRIFEVKQFGELGKGILTSSSIPEDIPFEVKRIVWIYGVEDNNERGNHANKKTDQVFYAVNGTVTVELIDENNNSSVYELNHPKQGLFVPPNYFRRLVFSKDAILVAISSLEYIEEDYVRDLNDFLVK